MNAYVKAWQCIGCGKIEAPQTCIGVCQDRKVEFVYAFEHEEALAQLSVARRQAEALGTPRAPARADKSAYRRVGAHLPRLARPGAWDFGVH
jgi:hypothetical protein